MIPIIFMRNRFSDYVHNVYRSGCVCAVRISIILAKYSVRGTVPFNYDHVMTDDAPCEYQIIIICTPFS